MSLGGLEYLSSILLGMIHIETFRKMEMTNGINHGFHPRSFYGGSNGKSTHGWDDLRNFPETKLTLSSPNDSRPRLSRIHSIEDGIHCRHLIATMIPPVDSSTGEFGGTWIALIFGDGHRDVD